MGRVTTNADQLLKDGMPSSQSNKTKKYALYKSDKLVSNHTGNCDNGKIGHYEETNNNNNGLPPTMKIKSTTDELMQISDLIGHWGKYQFMIYMFKILIGVTSAFNNLGVAFFAPTTFVSYWCKQSNDSRETSPHGIDANGGHDSISDVLSSFFYSPERNLRHSEHYDINYEKPANLRRECNLTMNDGSNEKCHSFHYDTGPWISTAIEEWNLVCGEREWLISLSQSLYMSGFIVSFLVFGYISDRFGRYKSLLCGASIEVLAGLGCASANSIEIFLVFRFLLGLGNAGRSSSSYLVMIEWVGKKYRMHISTLGSLGWVAGYCAMPWVSQYFLHFRHVQLLVCIYEFLLIIWLIFLPESPRWLLTHRRYDEARRVLYNAAKFNGRNDLDQFDVKFKQLELEMSSKKFCENEHKLNILDLFRTKNLRRYSIILYFAWAVNAFIYYGIALRVGDYGKNLFIDFTISGLTEIPSAAITMLTMKFMPRKTSNVFIFGSVGLICAMLTPLNAYNVAWPQTLLLMTAKFFISCSFTNVLYQTIEIYPTTLRQTASSSCMIAGRVGSILAPFIKELAQKTSTSYPPLIYAALAFITCTLITRLPETKGTEMPDTIEEAENFTGVKPAKSRVNKQKDIIMKDLVR